MGYFREVKRSDFFNELTLELQKEYFNLKEKKFLPTIDNIYYSVFLESVIYGEDENKNTFVVSKDNDCNGNELIKPLLQDLERLKNKVLSEHEPQDFVNGLSVDKKSFSNYKYCVSNPDLYDIFIASYLPNKDTPRIVVQLRAYGLWIHSAEKMLMESYNHVAAIFKPYGMEIRACRENRLDYCYHTNIISNPESIFKDKNINNQMSTTMQRWKQVGRIEKENGKVILTKDYFSLGDRNSNNIFIRIYNKGLEVIEEGYKNFFFDIWHKNGLISFYDKYCFEYTYTQTQKDYNNIHKAKLLFYLEYGTDSALKRKFELCLNDPNSTMADFKELAKKYMPPVTTIMNIEFETKRKFYYYSDNFIDGVLDFTPREGVPDALNRLFKIIDNRSVFLDYLTSTTLHFHKPNGDYVSWWKRLRNTKLEGKKIDEKLLRDYSSKLDERLARVRFINSVASNAVYADNLDSDFMNDISDLLSNLNDNDIHKLNITCYTDDGEVIVGLDNKLLEDYGLRKVKKEKQLKNRKKKRAEMLQEDN